ncbi:MAG: thioredoxin domain-containing protein [Phycisphaerales bacterium]
MANDQPVHRNRLAASSSPYLLQHASNPVDWFEWGEGAFAEARRRDVPIFLSIGYSTCYWCHVMERESFESVATAEVMNERFVCIKLDREQRPDLDDLYMTAAQLMTGRGGWPLSVFLEPDTLHPFFCGTYFPPRPRHNLPSFQQVLVGMSDAYRQQRDEVRRQAEAVGNAVREQVAAHRSPVWIGPEQVEQTIGTLLRIADTTRGGFGGAPKFPQPAYLDLLLEVRQAADTATREAVDRVLRVTLDQMMIGGIHDQIGGGFHRYAVDAEWTVPHFEKMLYDTAQLLSTYAAAAEAFGSHEYTRVVDRAVRFALRDLRGERGGFWSAIDAEVDHREGLNYLWADEDLREALEEPDASWAIRLFGLDRGPNFQDPHHPDEPARSVLRLDEPLAETADRDGVDASELFRRFDALSERLLGVRTERKQPHTDDKVLAAWNGMMLHGLADAYRVTRNESALDAAIAASSFVADHMLKRRSNAPVQLLRSWRNGRGEGPAVLEDSAHVIAGLVAVHRVAESAGRDTRGALDLAIELADAALVEFRDAATGRFYDTRADQPDLFARTGSTYDGATPSATSAAINAMIDLWEATGEDRFREAAEAALVAISAAIAESPVATCNSVRALFRAMRLGWRIEERLRAVGATPGESEPERETPALGEVEIYASEERVAVTNDRPAVVELVLRIRDGYHIIAAKQDGDDAPVRPLRIEVAGGTGVAVFAAYPDGEPLEIAGVEHPLRVHTGDLEFPIILERQGERSGRPILMVSYQACTGEACRAPRTVELDVAIDLD